MTLNSYFTTDGITMMCMYCLQLVPVRDGSLSVTVYDLCIDSLEPAVASISVSGVGSVQLHVMDKVRFYVKSQETATSCKGIRIQN